MLHASSTTLAPRSILLFLMAIAGIGCSAAHRNGQEGLSSTASFPALQHYTQVMISAQAELEKELSIPSTSARPIVLIRAIGQLPSAKSHQYANALAVALANAGVREAEGLHFEEGNADSTYDEMAKCDALSFGLLIWDPREQERQRPTFTPKLSMAVWRNLCMAVIENSPSDNAVIWALQNMSSPDRLNFTYDAPTSYADELNVIRPLYQKAFARLNGPSPPPNLTTISALMALQNEQITDVPLGYASTFSPPSGHDIQDLMIAVNRQLDRQWAAFPHSRNEKIPFPRKPMSFWRNLDQTTVASFHASEVIRPFIFAVNKRDDEAARQFLVPALRPKAHDLYSRLTHGEPTSIAFRLCSPAPEGHNVMYVQAKSVYPDWRNAGSEVWWVTMERVGDKWLIGRIRNILE